MANTWPEPAGPDRVRRIKVWTPDELGQGGAYQIALPPWGYLEGVEIRMRELVPNMDASRPHRLALGIGEGWGPAPLPMDVVALVRDVLNPGEAADPWAEAARAGDTTVACPACGASLRGHLELVARRPE